MKPCAFLNEVDLNKMVESGWKRLDNTTLPKCYKKFLILYNKHEGDFVEVEVAEFIPNREYTSGSFFINSKNELSTDKILLYRDIHFIEIKQNITDKNHEVEKAVAWKDYFNNSKNTIKVNQDSFYSGYDKGKEDIKQDLLWCLEVLSSFGTNNEIIKKRHILRVKYGIEEE